MRSDALRTLTVLLTLALAGCLLPEIDTPPIDPALIEEAKKSGSSGGGSTGDCVSGTYAGSITLTATSSKLGNYEGQCILNGTLTIDPSAKSSDIAKLNELSEIKGQLVITGAGNKEKRTILSNLRTVGQLSVQSTTLQYMPRLPSLRTVEGTLTIRNNSVMQDLDGLPNLQKIGTRLIVQTNFFRRVLTFNSLSDCNDIRFRQNHRLEELPGFTSLVNAGSIYIEENCSLMKLKFTALKKVAQLQVGKGMVGVLELPVLVEGNRLNINDNQRLTSITAPVLSKLHVVNLKNDPLVKSLDFFKFPPTSEMTVCECDPALTQQAVIDWLKSKGSKAQFGKCGVVDTKKHCG